MQNYASILDQFSSLRKDNVQTLQKYNQQCSSDSILTEFHTLKQINRILDSNPDSQEGKQQKIKSLIVMFQRQLDINKKLQAQLSDSNYKVSQLEKQILLRATQMKSYEKTIIELKQKVINLEKQSKKLQKKISQTNQQIKLKDELLQKMRQSFLNQKISMQNELHYLKQKNLDHFKQKLSFSTKNIQQIQNIRPLTQQKSVNKKQRNRKSSKNLKQKKENIIKRNILALSKKQNQLKTGQNLLKKFQETQILTQRMKQIRKGNYHFIANLKN